MHTVSEYIRSLFAEGKLCNALQEVVAEMLLSTSRFSDYAWKKLSIRLVKDTFCKQGASESLYLARWATQRQICLSIKPLEELELFLTTDPRSNAQVGKLVLHQVAGLIKQQKSDCAFGKLVEWAPFTSEISTLEESVVFEKEITVARIYYLRRDLFHAQLLYSELYRNIL